MINLDIVLAAVALCAATASIVILARQRKLVSLSVHRARCAAVYSDAMQRARARQQRENAARERREIEQRATMRQALAA